jgi:hypothetical protein
VDKVYAGAYTDLENLSFRQRDDASAYSTDRRRIADLPYQMMVNVVVLQKPLYWRTEPIDSPSGIDNSAFNPRISRMN